MVYFIINNTVM